MLPGRVEGRRDGENYVIRQGATVLKSIPLSEALLDAKLAAAIKRNGWEAVQ